MRVLTSWLFLASKPKMLTPSKILALEGGKPPSPDFLESAERNEGVNILAVFGQQAQDVNTLENSGLGGGEAPLT